MIRLIGWVFFTFALCVAVIAFVVLAYTYYRPPVPPDQLLHHAELGTTCAVSYLAGVLVFGLGGGFLERTLAKRSLASPVVLPRSSWYIKLLGVIAGLMFLQILFSRYQGVELIQGQWRTTKSRGALPQPLAVGEAVNYLWRNLRTHSAAVVIISSLLMDISYRLIHGRRLHGRPDAGTRGGCPKGGAPSSV